MDIKDGKYDRGQPNPLAVGEIKAADLLDLSPRTLWTLRATGRGPRYRRAGRRVLYAIKDLEIWLNSAEGVKGS